MIPESLIETARDKETGHLVPVLRRRGLRYDEQIMRALEKGQYDVIGTTQRYRYKKRGLRKWHTPDRDSVFRLDSEGRVLFVQPGSYFRDKYTIVRGGGR